MSDERSSAVMRLDQLQALLCADGWPEWLDSMFVDRSGPTVQLHPDAPADARADVERLAAAHGVLVTFGESYFHLGLEGRRTALPRGGSAT